MKRLVLLRLEPRIDDPGRLEWLLRVVAGLALVIIASTLMLILAGHDPTIAYAALYRGAFGSARALAATVNKAVPIGLCAVGIAIAYRARLWNIGAEGQLYMGAFAAGGVGLFLPETTPAIVALPLLILAGIAAGGIWAALAALPRALLGVNEILSTLMLTYVAIEWVGYLVTGPWADPRTFSFPYSAPIIAPARIGDLVGQVHGGILLLLLAAAALALIDRRLRWGYALRVFGDAPLAARYAGMDGRRLVLTALIAAGCLAGLAGAIEVAASTNRLQAGLSPGYGFMAVLVTALVKGRPLGILVASILYAGLLNGGFALQVSGIPPAIATILQAALLIGVLAALGLASYRIRIVVAAKALA